MYRSGVHDLESCLVLTKAAVSGVLVTMNRVPRRLQSPRAQTDRAFCPLICDPFRTDPSLIPHALGARWKGTIVGWRHFL